MITRWEGEVVEFKQAGKDYDTDKIGRYFSAMADCFAGQPKREGLTFTNGHELVAGEATGDVSVSALRRIQIREAVKAHFEKEQALFTQGIKVLSLFFIDAVTPPCWIRPFTP